MSDNLANDLDALLLSFNSNNSNDNLLTERIDSFIDSHRDELGDKTVRNDLQIKVRAYWTAYGVSNRNWPSVEAFIEHLALIYGLRQLK